MNAIRVARWVLLSAVLVGIGVLLARDAAEPTPSFVGEPRQPARSDPADHGDHEHATPMTPDADMPMSVPDSGRRASPHPDSADADTSTSAPPREPGAPGGGVTASPGLPDPAPRARVRDDERTRLAADLRGLLGTFPWREAEWGVLVVSLERGDTLFRHNANRALAPASNAKLLTTLAAFERMGPEYRYRTWVLSDGELRDGVLHGDLVLYGTGDPGFSRRFQQSRTGVFEALAVELQARGIRRIEGDLVADASFLPGPLRPPGWDPEDLNDHFAPGISALSFNENVVTFRLEPGLRAGAPPTVHSLPPGGLPVVNEGVTVAGRPNSRIAILRATPMEPFLVTGQIRQGGRDVWREMTVQHPALFTGTAFRSVLLDAGIEVGGRLRLVDRPGASILRPRAVHSPAASLGPTPRVLASWTSPPLRDYLEVVNKESNNLFAELVFRTLGRDGSGSGTAEEAAGVVREILDTLGVDAGGLLQLDGSGLSEGNRVSPATLVGLFEGARARPWWEEFWSTLPEAGRRRELPRMYRTAAAGNLRAKTGTIARVSALSGVVRSADGEPLAFSILVNGTPSPSRAKRVENAFGARLASFRRGG